MSVLIDHGLAEDIVEKLLEAGVATVEKLGSMTPEELEAIPSIGPQVVEKILVAVNSYYAQFEPGAEAGAPNEASAEGETAPEAEALPEGEFVAEDVVPESLDVSAESAAAVNGSEGAETGQVSGLKASDEKKEFDTIENSEGVR